MPAKKQVTKEMILDASMKLLREHGYEAVTIKELAKELSCSTQPIYLSFSGMEELRNELIPLAIETFEKYMKSRNLDGVIRLYETAYIQFAKNEPHLFCFLFMRPNAFVEIKQVLLPLIERSISQLMDTYHIDHDEADMLHDQLWMHAHGIATMVATNFCSWNMKKVDKMLSDCKCAFTKSYEA